MPSPTLLLRSYCDERIKTVGRVIVTSCVVVKGALTGWHYIPPGCVAIECRITVARIAKTDVLK